MKVLASKLKTIILGIFAGAAIGLGSLAFVLLKSADLKLLGSVAFSIGLLLVCFLGLNLYTGKIGFAIDNKKSYWFDLLLIFIGNAIGAAAFGRIFYFILRGNDAIVNALNGICNARFIGEGDSFAHAFGLSFFCGMLVFLAVYGFRKLPAKWMKALCIIACVALFVYTGMEHCIANIVYFSFNRGWHGSAFLNILITTTGNSIGALVTYQALRNK